MEILTALTEQQPRWAAAHYELGVSLGAARRGDEAVAALRRALELEPDLHDAWRALADHLTAAGDAQAADHAYVQHIRYSTRDPRLLEAGAALCDDRIAVAESLLREHLKEHPTDVAAIRMLGEVAARLGRYADAEALLDRCLELAPSFLGARHNYAFVLSRQNKLGQSLRQLDQLLASEPRNPGYRNLYAAILGRVGEYDKSLQVYAEVLKEYPRSAKVWMSYGHSLKTAGRQGECVETYRRAIELAPNLGEAYWSLAHLKTFRFTREDVAAMQEQLARGTLSEEDRFHFHFALGKAFEDEGDYARSFEHYEQGNKLRRALIQYDAEQNSERVCRSKQLLTTEFFAARKDWGSQAPDPIIIVGLPRAGSTLLERILSSHPLVEGTMELPDIIDIARSLGGRRVRGAGSKYPEALADVTPDMARELGEQYLANTRIQRKTGAPFFIDKMPNNFAHIGLIQLILPRAKIIDARRHPLGCCFSGFKQHFARGQHVSNIGAGVRAGVHARRRERRRRQPLRLVAERRHLSRRAADHDHSRRARRASLRHRAGRVTCRSARHVVRRQLASGHVAHHHQQAGHQQVHGGLRRRRVDCVRWRQRLSRRRFRERAFERQHRDSFGWLGAARSRLHRQRAGTRTFPISGITSDNAARAKDNYNEVDTIGARAALKIDLNDSWSITPQLMSQEQQADGFFAYDPRVGDLKLTHAYPENSKDRWIQAALSFEGKIAKLDMVYAGSYLKRDVDTHQDYADYFYWYDVCCEYGRAMYDDGTLVDPSQFITGKDQYNRYTHELRFSTDPNQRVRFVGGLFVQRQEHGILQRYQVNNLTGMFEVPGWADRHDSQVESLL